MGDAFDENWLRRAFEKAPLPKSDLARYLVTDAANVSRALSDPKALSDFQLMQARAFFSVVPENPSAEFADALRKLRSPSMRGRLVEALGRYLVASGMQATAGDHPVDRCIRGEPLRSDQIAALARALSVDLLELTRSVNPEVRSTTTAPKDRTKMLDLLERETRFWSRPSQVPYYIDQGRPAERTSEGGRKAAKNETNASAGGVVNSIVRAELQRTRAPLFDDITDAVVVLSNHLEPRFDCGEILCLSWQHAVKLTGRWVVIFEDLHSSSAIVGRVLAEHDAGLLLQQPSGARHQIALAPGVKIATILATRLP